MTGTYLIANLTIQVTSLHDEVHLLCASYRADGGAPDLCAEITQEDIDFERERSARTNELAGLPPRNSPDAYLETLAVYRKIAERLPEFDAMLVHGSCVAVDGRGYLFMAGSGTGKSTHARLWRELLGSRAVMVNDDKPIIRFIDGTPMIFGTPWDGKHRLSTNIGVPLKAIGFLSRGEKDAIRTASPGASYPLLLRYAYRPADPAAMQKTLALVDKLADSASLWQLQCTMSPTAAQVAYDAMKG